MSPKLKNLTSAYVLKFLLGQGFEVSHRKGSHVQLKNGELRVTVPDHGHKALNIRTVMSILRQSQVDRDDFLKG